MGVLLRRALQKQRIYFFLETKTYAIESRSNFSVLHGPGTPWLCLWILDHACQTPKELRSSSCQSMLLPHGTALTQHQAATIYIVIECMPALSITKFEKSRLLHLHAIGFLMAFMKTFIRAFIIALMKEKQKDSLERSVSLQ